MYESTESRLSPNKLYATHRSIRRSSNFSINYRGSRNHAVLLNSEKRGTQCCSKQKGIPKDPLKNRRVPKPTSAISERRSNFSRTNEGAPRLERPRADKSDRLSTSAHLCQVEHHLDEAELSHASALPLPVPFFSRARLCFSLSLSFPLSPNASSPFLSRARFFSLPPYSGSFLPSLSMVCFEIRRLR